MQHYRDSMFSQPMWQFFPVFLNPVQFDTFSSIQLKTKSLVFNSSSIDFLYKYIEKQNLPV